MAAANQNGHVIQYIKNPNQLVIKTALMNQQFINNQPVYEAYVKNLFENNAMLMKKWLRYGEAMRS
jgi:hypothetical protein